jgi:hypothetical protein
VVVVADAMEEHAEVVVRLEVDGIRDCRGPATLTFCGPAVS